MAVRGRTANTRRNYNRIERQSYVYGNVVTKPSYEPEVRRQSPKRRSNARVQARRRREQMQNMIYVTLLTVVAVVALIVCVNYIQLQSRITTQTQEIATLQSELTTKTEENTTRYNDVVDSVNLEKIREIAENDLGMVYATSDQIITYSNPAADYVKQYEAIPEDGVLAQSDK